MINRLDNTITNKNFDTRGVTTKESGDISFCGSHIFRNGYGVDNGYGVVEIGLRFVELKKGDFIAEYFINNKGIPGNNIIVISRVLGINRNNAILSEAFKFEALSQNISDVPEIFRSVVDFVLAFDA